ncbi:MAG: hypothetical protein KAJ24_01195, partial [Candidatus Aenigmarchaeota archaeon]|nr:hypothetical protein [Candidatus Aenigmarchaeota archaeon]
ISPQNQKIYYGNLVVLNYTLNDTCGTTATIPYNVSWGYADYNTPKTTICTANSTWNSVEWIPASAAYGNGTLSIEVDTPAYVNASASKNIQTYRQVSLSTLDIEEYPPLGLVSNITCVYSVNGLADKAGYNISFYIDNQSVLYNSTTNSTGAAIYEWNTTGHTKGPHEVGCKIFNSSETFFDIQNPTILSDIVIIPSELNASVNYLDNREFQSGCPPIIPFRFNNLPANAVYTVPGQNVEPDVLYLAANATTPWQDGGQLGQLYDVNGSVIHFHLENSTYIIEVANCTVDLDEYTSRPHTWDAYGCFEDYKKDYHCYTTYNPHDTLVPGTYNITVNVSKAGTGWTSTQENKSVIVRGVLIANITFPVVFAQYYQGDTMNLSATVVDSNGVAFVDNDLDYIRWTMRRSWTGCSTEEWTLNTSINGTYPLTLNWLQYENFVIQFEVKKDNYEPTFTRSVCPGDNCCKNNPGWKTISPVFITVKADAHIEKPSQTTVAVDPDGMLNVSCIARENITNEAISDYSEFYMDCIDCTAYPNNITQNLSAGNAGEVMFQWNITKEGDLTTGINRSFKCYLSNYTFDTVWRNTANQNDTEQFTVYKTLGGGEGSCNINNICEPIQGETVEVCPTECGYSNLPQEFWLNETAGGSYNETQKQQFNGTQYKWYEAHSAYPSDGAGGCNYDMKINSTYEDADYCPDYIPTNQPPVVTDNASTSYYARLQGTILNISANIRDIYGDLQESNVQILRDGIYNGTMSKISPFCVPKDSFCTFIYQTTTAIPGTYTILANDSEGNFNNNTFVVIIEDNSPVFISSVEYYVGPYKSGNPVSVDITLGNATNSTIKWVRTDGIPLTYSAIDEKWSGTVNTQSPPNNYLNITVEEFAGWYAENASTYISDGTPPAIYNLT